MKTPLLIKVYDYLRNYFLRIYCAFLLLSGLGLMLNIEIFSYNVFILLGLGWSLFFFKSSLNLLEHFVVGAVLNLSLFLTYSILLVIIGIPLSFISTSTYILLSLFFFFHRKRISLDKVVFIEEKFDILMLFVFVCTFIAKIISIHNFEVPPLHDPISHAYWTKSVLDSGTVEYFYSPGLHLLSAFNIWIGGFGVGQQILFNTNLFSIFIGVLAYIFVKKIYKRRHWAIITAVLLSLGYYPSILYIFAGKNSLIIGLTIVIVLLFLLSNKDFSLKFMILTNILLVGLFLTHYPLAVLGLIFLVAGFIIEKERKKYLSFIPGVMMGLLWMVIAYKYESKGSTMGQELQIIFNLKEGINYFYNSFVLSTSIKFTNLFRFFNMIGFIGILYLFIYCLRKKSKTILLPFSYILFIASTILITSLSLPVLSIVGETFAIIHFLFLYLGIGFLVSFVYCRLLKNFVPLEQVFFTATILLTLFFTLITYSQFYSKTEERNVIEKQDIEAFEWIDNNIPDKEGFLINAVGGNGYVFSSDSGGWLEIYTGNPVSMPFYEYSSLSTDINNNIYKKLMDNLSDCALILELQNRGYSYFYKGSNPVFGDSLAEDFELSEKGWILIYKNDNVTIFKLPICNNENLNNNNKL